MMVSPGELPQGEPMTDAQMLSSRVVLEAAAEQFANAVAERPYLYELGPEKGRAALDEVQSGAVAKPAVDIDELEVLGGPTGHVSVRIVRPQDSSLMVPVILCVHGAGWVFGDAQMYDRLVRELAVDARAAVVFVEYSRSPEARYPTALEEIYTVAHWIDARGADEGLDAWRVAIAGDSVGANMATAAALMAKARGGPSFVHQMLFYPVTDASFDTSSYHQFAEGFHLRRDTMMWFWDQYTTDPAQRAEITASPLRASTDELADLPPATVITAEADVLRDEGEAYASKLRSAGVPVTAARFDGTIHDFVMLNALAQTNATRGAMALATDRLRHALGTT
jgi:acetyl esterase/lipase